MLNPGSKVVGYPRVSTDDQASYGSSLDTQIEQIRAYCDRLGLVLVDIIPDEGVSSKTLKRPGLQRILGMIERGEIAGIVVAHLDRLTRSTEDACVLIRRYFSAPGGAEILSTAEHIDTRTAMGRGQFKLMVVFSEIQRESIVERTVENLDRKRRDSHRLGRDQFGKRLDPDDPARSRKGKPVKMVDDDMDMQAVAFVHARRRRNLSLQQIAEDLTVAGFPTKRGNPTWSKSTVAKILKRWPLPGDDA